MFACPAVLPGRPVVSIEFGGAGGMPLARARTPGLELCGASMDVRIRGRREPALVLGAFLPQLRAAGGNTAAAPGGR
jgi:hypothetical protein